MLVADAIGGVEAVELVLEHGRQHAEMLERLQREAAPPVADMDMEATGRIHKDVELGRQHLDDTFHPPQRPGTEAQRRRFDLNLALEESVQATLVLDRDGWLGRDCPFLVASSGHVIVSAETAVFEDINNVGTAQDP